MRIIGIELRIETNGIQGRQQTEIGIVPCDILVELNEEKCQNIKNIMMNLTLHTDIGDIGINNFPVNEYIFHKQI